jgi:hypothetical protein
MTAPQAKVELRRIKKEGWNLAEIVDWAESTHPQYEGRLSLINPINHENIAMFFKAPLSIESKTKVLGSKAKLLRYRVECGVCDAVLLEGLKVTLSGSKNKGYGKTFRDRSKVMIIADKQEKILDIAVKDANELSVATNFRNPKTVFSAQEENGASHGCFLSHGTNIEVEIRGVPRHKGALMVNTNLFTALYTTRESGTSPYDQR